MCLVLVCLFYVYYGRSLQSLVQGLAGLVGLEGLVGLFRVHGRSLLAHRRVRHRGQCGRMSHRLSASTVSVGLFCQVSLAFLKIDLLRTKWDLSASTLGTWMCLQNYLSICFSSLSVFFLKSIIFVLKKNLSVWAAVRQHHARNVNGFAKREREFYIFLIKKINDNFFWKNVFAKRERARARCA